MLCSFTLYTISISLLCVSREGLSLFQSNRRLYGSCKWVTFEKQRHCRPAVEVIHFRPSLSKILCISQPMCETFRKLDTLMHKHRVSYFWYYVTNLNKSGFIITKKISLNKLTLDGVRSQDLPKKQSKNRGKGRKGGGVVNKILKKKGPLQDLHKICGVGTLCQIWVIKIWQEGWVFLGYSLTIIKCSTGRWKSIKLQSDAPAIPQKR